MTNSIPQDLKIYHNNQNLLLAGEPYKYTKHEIDEFKKCKDSLLYFVENYYKIIDVDTGLIQFKARHYQEKYLKLMEKNRNVITKWPRQSGKSTTSIGFLLWFLIFNANITVGILAQKAETAQELFHRLRLAYEHLPKFLQPGIANGGWNKRSMHLGNGSRCIAGATSSGSVRGMSFRCIFLDEFAHIEDNVADDFWKSVYPTISSGKETKVIITSTPKGYNHFYDMWTKAEKKQTDFIPMSINWNDPPGRDEKWKLEQIEVLGPAGFRQEFESSFEGSSTTLISPDKLVELQKNVIPPLFESEGLNIYEKPIPGHNYAICVDTSRGQNLDYHAFCVVDVTNFPYKLVGMFRRNDIHPTILPNYIFNVWKQYNYAAVLVEVSDIGAQVADMLVGDLDCEIIRVSNKPGKGQTIGMGIGSKIQNGLKTSPATKRIGCADLKALIETDKLIVQDKETVKEFMSFVADNQSFSAEEGKHDDCVMSLVLFGWLSHQRYFRHENTDIRAELEKLNEEYLENQLTPFGIVDDGLDFVDAYTPRY